MNKKSTQYPIIEWSLEQARSAISTQTPSLAQEKIPVTESLARVNAPPLLASRPKPSYNQSSRDGFALSSHPHSVDGDKATFRVIGEIAAGCRERPVLQSGDAVRIMTGAMTPDGATRVTPFEICADHGHTVDIPLAELTGSQPFIRRLGSDVQKGDLLIAAGTRLQADHLLILAENSWLELPVYKQPQVAVICTGSELVEVGAIIQPGQKISGNGVLLSALLQTNGATCPWSITAGDQVATIVKQVRQLLNTPDRPDMIITTGGMGPGKFDLMEQVFSELTGTVVYNRLQVRPGKSTLMGFVEQIPFFALPGPPPAVRILFHELITPALNRLQGCKKKSTTVSAILEEAIPLKQSGHLSLKGCLVRLVDGRLQVRPAGRMEPINAIMHLDNKGAVADKGTVVEIRLIDPLQGLAV